MIASHNSFTYLPARFGVFEIFSKFWRCQNKDYETQVKEGVQVSDIRVRKVRDGWRFCHGIVDLPVTVPSLKYISDYVETESKRFGKELYYRIVLERCNIEDYKCFLLELDKIEKDKRLIYYAVKHLPFDAMCGDGTIKKRGSWDSMEHYERLPQTIKKSVDLCFKEWTFKNIVKALFTGYNPIADDCGKYEDTEDVLIWKDFV